MNRFRTKKKAKDAANEEAERALEDVPPVPKTSKTFRRKKNQEPEKLELDLTNALPSSDDFRTSLLMSGLSARFSMLREQDDPSSKIGKASDDSVLFPTKRQSRDKMSFAPYGLSDIAEVSSIHSGLRPPFAYGRTDSYDTVNSTDADSTHSGSMMSRPKPGEGNNLFGGRQKIYKIPAGGASSKSLADGGGMGGRALYDDDVSQSAFQKLREREREQERGERQEREDREDAAQEELHSPVSRPSSPPLNGYNRNRETSSTTSSGPLHIRTSTAATSISSQRTPSLRGDHTPVSAGGSGNGVEKSSSKGRRLYENGLDKHLHDQQNSSLSRIDTLSRQRNLGSQTPPLALGSPSASSTKFQLADRWDREPAAKSSLPNLRVMSPTNSEVNAPFEHASGLASPPLSPLDYDERKGLAAQPRKLPAHFAVQNKPAQSYDEHQYSQRQIQMQQEREPHPRKILQQHPFMSRQQPPVGRPRTGSNSALSGRSRSGSSAQKNPFIQDRGSDSSFRHPNPLLRERPIPETSLYSPVSSTGFNSENEDADLSRKGPTILQPPPVSQHPANRPRAFEPYVAKDGPTLNVPGRLGQSGLLQPPATSAPKVTRDPPGLTPLTGLSGMIRNHLRSDSNSSSVYGAPSPNLRSSFSVEPLDPLDHIPGKDYEENETKPWDVKQSKSDKPDIKGPVMDSHGGQSVEDMAPAVLSPSSQIDVTLESADANERNPSMEKASEPHHTRIVSDASRLEQEDFQAELAARRRRVQENLKSFVEADDQPSSQGPGSNLAKEESLAKSKSMGVLKTKISKGALGVQKSRTMNKLGLGNTTISSAPSPNRALFNEGAASKTDEEEIIRNVSSPTSPDQPQSFRQARRDAQRDRERELALSHQQRIAAGARNKDWKNFTTRPQRREETENPARNAVRELSRERRPIPLSRDGSQVSQESKASANSSYRQGSRAARDRSMSNVSGPSESRNGDSKEPKGVAEGSPRSGQATEDTRSLRQMPKSPGFPNGPTSVHPTPVDLYLPSRSSPIAPFSMNATPVLAPISPSLPSSPRPQLQSRGSGGSRKKSVNKHEISEPTFLSATSRMDTVNLPVGASLQNGMDVAPPIPAVNPRRKTRAMFGALMGKKEEFAEQSLLVATQSTDDMRMYSAGDDKPRRQHLRKSSSEGALLGDQARQTMFSVANREGAMF